MALDIFQRTLGDVEFTATVAGSAITVATVVNGGSGYLVGDTIDPSEITSEAVIDTGVLPTDFLLTVATVGSVALGDIATFTITTPGTDGTDGDLTANRDGGTEAGIPNTDDYYDHNQYEGGGQIDEYKTGTGAIVTVGTGDVTAIVAGGVNYRVGDVLYAAGGDNGADLTVDTVDGVGAITGFTAGGTGVGYADADFNTVFVSRTLNTVATGEYAGVNADNDPTVSVGRLPDAAQLKVQKKYIGGAYGTVEVFAEPTTVNSVGQVVGNVLRAEDITDEYRCVSAYLSDGVTPRFKWVTNSTGDADSASYGYCTEKTAAELAGDALVDADCPAGFVHSGGNCVVVDIATINSKEAVFDADRTTDGATGTNNKTAMEQCLANGGYYEPKAASGSRCIDASVADNFSLANFAFGTVSSAQDYAATVCRQEGYDWITPDMTCVAKADVTTLVTQATCAAAGHVWVAGTCYDKADFGDGYSRQGNEGDVNTQPK